MTRFALTATTFANTNAAFAASGWKGIERKICVALALAVALTIGVPMSQAQSTLANVPFDFKLENGTMSAGSYAIYPVSSQVLAVRNLETGESRFVITAVRVRASKVQPPKLVFDKCGNQYFLRQIWNGRDIQGIEIPTSAAEKELNAASTNFPDGSKTAIVAMK
jgi:hypothetical protein